MRITGKTIEYSVTRSVNGQYLKFREEIQYEISAEDEADPDARAEWERATRTNLIAKVDKVAHDAVLRYENVR